MKFIIDNKIPYIKGILEPYAEVVYLPGNEISNRDVRDADALIIRTRTICNASLLEGSRVRFIATATIGYDHIDTIFCQKNGIEWANAAGSNAQSVAQYITSALVALSLKYELELPAKTIGIVGVGNVGKRVAAMMDALGLKVLLNDPPREEKEGKNDFVSMKQISEEADIITFHTPLVKNGKYQTYHTVNETFLSNLSRKPVIINSARGEIIDTAALKNAISEKKTGSVVLDCWENEPDIDPDLLQKTDIATPHIAGYSADGKANATSMSVQAVSRFFHLGLDNWEVSSLPTPAEPVIYLEKENIAKAILHSYDILQDNSRLKINPLSFENLRGNYPLRREYGAYKIKGYHSTILDKLGFGLY